jgi:hypothetical protein
MNFRIAIAAAWFGLMPLAPASAAIFCATNETELRAALATIGSTFSSENNELRLTRRVYFTGTQTFATTVSGPTGNLLVSGGWATAGGSPTACDVQQTDARLTVIDAQGTSAVLSITRNSVSGNATPLIAVSNLTLRNGNAASAPVGLYVANSFGSIEVDNVIVHGNRATASQYLGGVAITLDSTRNDIRLRNSLVYDNQGVMIFGPQPLASVVLTSLALAPSRNWYASNNTVFAGPDASAEAIRMQSDGNFWVINNVVRGTIGYDGSITGAGAATPPQLRQLFNNFSTLPSTTSIVVVSNLSNSTVNPMIDPVTFFPQPGSPLINGGLGSPPGGTGLLDVYGQNRVSNTVVDIGAVEYQGVANVAPCTLDVDGNGSLNPLTDGLMIVRAMLGLTGTAVTSGALAGNSARNTWALVRAYLNTSCGANFAP